jgi:hypothetical protein
MPATLLDGDRFDAATGRLDSLIERANEVRDRYPDAPLFPEVFLVELVAGDMDLHRVHLAELIALAAVRLAEHATAAAPVSPAGPYCQGCRQPLRPGEPAHVCHEHRANGRAQPWVCPVVGHTDGTARRSGPATIEVDGDVVRCLFPGCGRNSDEPDRRECCCETYEPCAGECCGPGQCSCSPLSLRGPSLPHTCDLDGNVAGCPACTVTEDAREVRRADR